MTAQALHLFLILALLLSAVGMFAAACFELGRRHEQTRQERELFRRAEERRAEIAAISQMMETEHENS